MGCASFKPIVYDGTQLTLHMNEKQKDLIRMTWELMNENLTKHGLMVFRRLFQLDQDLLIVFKQVYNKNQGEIDEEKLSQHSLIVMQSLGAAVESLDDSLFLTNVLIAIGEKHAEHSVKETMLPKMWPAIRYALKEILQECFTEEVDEAWKIVFDFLISKLSEGIRRAGNKRKIGSRKPSKVDGSAATGPELSTSLKMDTCTSMK